MRRGRGSTLLVRAVLVGLLATSLPGCAAHLAERERSLELGLARAEAERERIRVAELEARLLRVEAELGRGQRAVSNAETPVLAKLDALIALNRELLHRTPEATEATLTSTSGGTSASTNSVRPVDHACGAGSAEEQLERLVRRLHGHGSGWRDGLSLEQSRALRVLLRRKRELDSASPWH